ncbi:MAG: DNA-directed RNA polymerase subunit K [Candidatus Micrarchaeia archaeon]
MEKMEEMNRFEKARILGARTLQLAMGAPALIEIKGEFDPFEVAKKEFELGLIPLVVKRKKE